MANDKKVALVTGANRGIGLETARQLGRNGITVVVAARSQAAANEAAQQLEAEGLDVFPIQLDVTNSADRTAAAKTIFEKFGQLDILINNAGVGAEDGMFARQDRRNDRGGTPECVRHESLLRRCRYKGISPSTQEQFGG